MSQLLDTVYALIKDGKQAEAVEMLNPIIRADRDNEDAWWLLANATDRDDAKRNALNNVLRLSSNETRIAKANNLIKALNDDPYNFNVTDTSNPKLSAYEAIDDAQQKKSGGLSCATLSLIIVGLIGVCACAGIFGLFAVAGDAFSFVNAPETYIDNGTLSIGETYTGTLTEDSRAVGFIFDADNGESITMTVTSDNATAPFIIIYNPETDLVVTGTNGFQGAFYQPQTYNNTLVATFTAPAEGNYLITLRGTSFAGTNIGFGNFTFDVE